MLVHRHNLPPPLALSGLSPILPLSHLKLMILRSFEFLEQASYEKNVAHETMISMGDTTIFLQPFAQDTQTKVNYSEYPLPTIRPSLVFLT